MRKSILIAVLFIILFLFLTHFTRKCLNLQGQTCTKTVPVMRPFALLEIQHAETENVNASTTFMSYMSTVCYVSTYTCTT